MSEVSLSVIMPAYNCESLVASAINSVLDQTYSDFELLVADDASIDKTKKIIDELATKDSRIKTFHNDVNQGYLRASNLLFAKCKGKFITFQDADDLSDTTRFEKLMKAFIQNNDVDCIGSNSLSFVNNPKEGVKSEFPTTYEKILSDYPTKIVITGSALMIKRRVLEKVGFYNVFFDRIASEDIYWYGCIIDEFKAINLDEPLYFYRANPNSLTRNHKNERALISHDVCMYVYALRKKYGRDPIRDNDKRELDFICTKLLAEYYIKRGNLKKAFSKLLNLLSVVYKLDVGFFRLFIRQTIYHTIRI